MKRKSKTGVLLHSCNQWMENVSEKLPLVNNQFFEEQTGLTSIILLFFNNTTQTLLTGANWQPLVAADEVSRRGRGCVIGWEVMQITRGNTTFILYIKRVIVPWIKNICKIIYSSKNHKILFWNIHNYWYNHIFTHICTIIQVLIS